MNKNSPYATHHPSLDHTTLAGKLMKMVEAGVLTHAEAKKEFVRLTSKATVVPDGWLDRELRSVTHVEPPPTDPHPKTIDEVWERAAEAIESARNPNVPPVKFLHPLIGTCAVFWERQFFPDRADIDHKCTVFSRPWQSHYTRLCRVYKADTTLAMLCFLREDQGYTLVRDFSPAERTFPRYTSTSNIWSYHP